MQSYGPVESSHMNAEGVVVRRGPDVDYAVWVPDEAYPQMGSDGEIMAAAFEMMKSLDPDALDAIATEIDDFKHSARAASLRAIAKRQRAALAKAAH